MSSNRHTYEAMGTASNGKLHGHWVVHGDDGYRYEGEYRDGDFYGRGTLTWPDGSSVTCDWDESGCIDGTETYK